ncbi:hypothetical protein [Streptomyces sp. NPDC058625]|uniref:hypothetical protein n=1 Tax=Streptomyces sp. NPDC058625 TaxID=3346564 RepID=UPI00365BE74C
MTDQQLRGPEKTRAGNDLALRAELFLTALAETKHWPVADDQEIIRVPHAAWSNALTQLDAGAFVDVLTPVTTVEARATGARRIREAKTAIRNGRYEHAVALAERAAFAARQAGSSRTCASSADPRAARLRRLRSAATWTRGGGPG